MQLTYVDDLTELRDERSAGLSATSFTEGWSLETLRNVDFESSWSLSPTKDFVSYVFVGPNREWGSDRVATTDETEATSRGGDGIDVGWIFEALRSTDDSGTGVLSAVIDGVNTLIGDSKFNILDSALTGIDVDTASKHVLLALARSTYPARTKLSEWKGFVNRVDETFRHRELDSDRLLKGLLH